MWTVFERSQLDLGAESRSYKITLEFELYLIHFFSVRENRTLAKFQILVKDVSKFVRFIQKSFSPSIDDLNYSETFVYGHVQKPETRQGRNSDEKNPGFQQT